MEAAVANKPVVHTTGTKKAASVNAQIIVFKLGGEEYGLPIDLIKEVVITPAITRIPLAPKHIKGVANVRGTILAVVDLEERLSVKESLESSETEKPNFLLVIESEDYKMGILVKEVPNTLSVSEDNIDNSPGLVQEAGSEKGYVKGIVKTDKRLVILVDVFKLISKEEVSV
jgi:purine-binding chemotaxis protein CheW